MKKKTYLVLDTETATMPFADEIAGGDSERKKRIAIAKPLIYDFAYCLTQRDGTIIDSKQFLIAETFSVPTIFNTAYYAKKRPIYLEMLKRGETVIKPWNEVMEIFIADMKKVDAVGAFNAMFDYVKAIRFTDLYISQLYSPSYFAWEELQKKSAARIADGEKPTKNPDFEPDIFRFRGNIFPLFDIWGLATTYLLNNASYKRACLEHGLLTNSGTYFKTSAESTFQYLCNKYDFIEAHTALEDAKIESFILAKIAEKHAITPGIKYFPFRDLGYTDEFCMRLKRPKVDECIKVHTAISAYVDKKQDEADTAGEDISAYVKGLLKRLDRLATYAGI